jgi:chromosome segregation ATPase
MYTLNYNVIICIRKILGGQQMSENTIKPATFRLNEGDINRFKEFANQNNLNQQEAFTSLLNTLELNNAKSTLGDRAKSIEVFQTTVNNLVKFYINSLEENTTTEDRIKEELSLQLTTKDKTIADMQNKLQEVKEGKALLDNSNIDLSNKNKELQEQLNKLQNDIKDKDKYIDNLQQQNELLTTTLNEYKEYKEINIKLDKENKDLKTENTTLNNSNKQLEDKLKNDVDMLEFYKNQIQEQKEETKALNKSMLEKEIEYKANIKAIEEKNKQQVLEVEKKFKELLEKQINENKEQLNNKLELELGKKDLELEKLKNKLDNLQTVAKVQ